jgi:predicted DNA-binding transcriptional regulator
MDLMKEVERVCYNNNNNNYRLSKKEMIILAITYKSGKDLRVISRLLNVQLNTARNYVANLTSQGLLRSIKVKRKFNKKHYVFDGTDEQKKKCPEDVLKYINDYWGDKN